MRVFLSILLLCMVSACAVFQSEREETPAERARREAALVQCSQSAAEEFLHSPLPQEQKEVEINTFISQCMNTFRKNKFRDVEAESEATSSSNVKGTPINAPSSSSTDIKEVP